MLKFQKKYEKKKKNRSFFLVVIRKVSCFSKYNAEKKKGYGSRYPSYLILEDTYEQTHKAAGRP